MSVKKIWVSSYPHPTFITPLANTQTLTSCKTSTTKAKNHVCYNFPSFFFPFVNVNGSPWNKRENFCLGNDCGKLWLHSWDPEIVSRSSVGRGFWTFSNESSSSSNYDMFDRQLCECDMRVKGVEISKCIKFRKQRWKLWERKVFRRQQVKKARQAN